MTIFLIILGCLVVVCVIAGFISNSQDAGKQKTLAEEKILELKKQDYDNLSKELQENYNNQLEELQKTKKELQENYNIQLAELIQKQQEEERKIQEKQDYWNKCIKDIEYIIKEKCNYYPQLAAIMADLLTLYYERSARYLETKPHPAYHEAKRIRELRKETQHILAEKKNLEHKLAYIEYLFPDITQIFDNGFEAANIKDDTPETYDRILDFLSKEEYKSLSDIERNQLALERYITKRKSNWQIGRDYELYISYLCSQKGYAVENIGIIKGLEDLGRDIVAKRNSETLIIQCKRWAKWKTLYEKHIFQLFGTVTLYKLENPMFDAKGIFITSTTLSKKAKEIAEYLGIEVLENIEQGDYPRIKCNINRQTGEKIYHLPFDQQYDTAVIEEKRGECYCFTTQEAHDLGFRRAFKHKNKSN